MSLIRYPISALRSYIYRITFKFKVIRLSLWSCLTMLQRLRVIRLDSSGCKTDDFL